MALLSLEPKRFAQWMFIWVGLWVMYNSMQLYFTWFIPQSLTMVFSYVAIVNYVLFNKLIINRSRLFSILLLLSVFIYELVFVYPLSFLSIVHMFSRILFVIVLICTPLELMKLFLRQIIKVTAFLILISLIFWVFYLIGIPLPHYSVETNNYYDHTVYYFFILNGSANQILPRFAGLFLEPGHLGSTACMLLFLNGVDLRKWENKVFIVAVILSLSLAAYGLLIGCIALYFIAKSKYGFIKLFPYVGILALLVLFFSQYNGGNNPVNEKILMRLVIEDGEISGNNRTSMVFDNQYDRYVTSSDVLLGKGRSVIERSVGASVLYGTASWKRYFFIRGYVGCAILLLFLFYYAMSYNSMYGWSFLIIYLVCNAIRDYPIDELWLYLIIIAMPIFKYDFRINSYLS